MVVISMVFLIASMETLWCIKLKGHIQTLGFHRSHRWGTQKPIVNIEVVNNLDWVLFRGVNQTDHLLERVWGLGLCKRCQGTRRHFLVHLEADGSNLHVILCQHYICGTCPSFSKLVCWKFSSYKVTWMMHLITL